MTIKKLDGDKVAVSAEAMQALARPAMKPLILNLHGIYFEAIKSGEKKIEYRLVCDRWNKRLLGKEFSHIVICYGYPAHHRNDRRINFKWKGYKIETITHPHFGDKPVQVFAIDCTERITP